MTVAKLMKILEKCNPRAKVAVYIDSFEKIIPEWNTINIESANLEFLEMTDGDGFTAYRKDGNVKGKYTVVIRGNKELNEGT